MQQVTSVMMPENTPCQRCSKEVLFIQLNAMNRSPSPFAPGSQKTSTSISRNPKKNKDDWKGSGKCSRCKGDGKVTKYASPLARQLAYENEYA